MSVYITIRKPRLFESPYKNIYLTISSATSILKTQELSPAKSPIWQISILSSVKEKRLQINVYQRNLLETSKQHDLIGESVLRFSSFSSLEEKRSLRQTLRLVNKNKQTGELFIDIDHDSTKNYVGDIEFWQPPQNGKMETKETLITEISFQPISPIVTITQISPSKQSMFEDSEIVDKQTVIFYKGLCKNKNLFSICDAEVQDETFEIVEDRYRDRLT